MSDLARPSALAPFRIRNYRFQWPADLLTSWAAHDALHLRQIAKRLFQLAERDGGEYNSRYAGEWRA